MLTVKVLRGSDIDGHLDDVARLRIEVFRAWPYLYAGNLGYERDYLQTYSRASQSVFVLALDGDEVVGAATGVPLEDETAAVTDPLSRQGVRIENALYFGESVLRPRYRGQGLGHRFFDEREAHARSLGRSTTLFCSVVRSPDDPRRPPEHRSHDAFWTRRGYRQMAGIRCRLDWQEVGSAAASTQELAFWIREAAPR